MNDQKKREKRLRELKLREAHDRREFNLQEANALAHEAQVAHDDGDSPLAVRLARKALALYPENPGALNLLGLVYFEANQFADSASYFGPLRKIDSGFKRSALYNFGLASFKLHRHEEARKAFEEFLEVTSPGEREWETSRLAAQRCLSAIPAAAAPAAIVHAPKPQPPKLNVRPERCKA